jgi:prolyl oligopeptidase
MAAFTGGNRRVREANDPPETRSEPVTDLLHGHSIVDAYRWLEGDNEPVSLGRVTPEVAEWTDAQNAYTRRVLDSLPGRSALEQRLRPLMEVGSVWAPAVRADRYFYARREGSQNQPVIYVRKGYRGADHVLLDPAKIDGTGLTTITWTSPSRDGRLLAYGTYRAGDENATLHLLDVDTRRELPVEIVNKVEAPQWLPDGSGFLYRNLGDAGNPYSARVLFHRLGTNPVSDEVLFRQFTPEEDPKLATTWGPSFSLSHDGRWVLFGYWTDTRSNDLWVASLDEYRRTGSLAKHAVSVGTEGTAAGTVIGGQLYLHTTKGAPRGRVVGASVDMPGEAHWCDVVPERPDAVIDGVAFARGRMVVTWLRNASSVVEVFDMSGRSEGLVRLPGIGSATVDVEEDSTEAYLTFTSFNHPASIFRIDLSVPQAEPELWERPAVPVDPSLVDVDQIWCPSKDGTPISMFLVHRKGLVRSGDAPTILWGYGGFNISCTPAFSPTLFPWFEDGGVYALPNLRGGGEYGDGWHEAGTLGRKQNTFDDFASAAEWLIANRYTSPARLSIAGGSNGGLLTGALVTQRPDLFRSAIVAVPLLDMLRYQYFLMARYWVPEYGTSEDAAQFEWLAAYSPYHHVRPGTPYPAVFLTAGEHDTRVHALHARKMAAALQAATTSDPSIRPVLLWVDRESGHGQGKPLSLRLRDVVDQRIFTMWQLGMLESWRHRESGTAGH